MWNWKFEIYRKSLLATCQSLPDDILQHFDYPLTTLIPYFTVKAQKLKFQSNRSSLLLKRDHNVIFNT